MKPASCDFPANTVSDDPVKTIGHVFARPALLVEALTHPSAIAPIRGNRRRRLASPQGYERLEFLGDRVLGLVVADLLWRRHPDETEGHLTRRHAQLVRRDALAEVARRIGLDRHLVASPAEVASGAARNPSILADICEAVIAAIYLDAGYAAAFAFVERWWWPLIDAMERPPQDPKTRLQEWAQARGLGLPAYRVVATEGPSHAPRFTVAASVAQSEEASATGSSKRAAETGAAAALLERLAGDA
ncbi:MAG TPA: ribonuclease III [Stellaceae bacterium]|nr:ribonuclease III [Stellaceae bacterium]